MCILLGKERARHTFFPEKKYSPVGAIGLKQGKDGYTIYEVVDAEGTLRYPFGEEGMKPRELLEFIRGVNIGAEMQRRKEIKTIQSKEKNSVLPDLKIGEEAKYYSSITGGEIKWKRIL